MTKRQMKQQACWDAAMWLDEGLMNSDFEHEDCTSLEEDMIIRGIIELSDELQRRGFPHLVVDREPRVMERKVKPV